MSKKAQADDDRTPESEPERKPSDKETEDLRELHRKTESEAGGAKPK